MKRTSRTDLALGLGLTVVVPLALEALLALAGVRPPARGAPLSRGFDPQIAYLVPDPEREGGFVTRFSDGAFEEKRVGPRRPGVRRVVLFGGSNTQSFGTTPLQSELDRLAGPGAYEVVNLGRQGYGSERVAILVEQAVERLAPDWVVVYAGHNEFVERGFRIDVDALWAGEVRGRIGATASRSRLVGLLADALRPSERAVEEPAEAPAPLDAETLPERHRDEYAKFAGLPWSETQRYFSAYRANLERMRATAAARGARVVLCTPIYNRFAAPFESTLPATLDHASRARFLALRGEIEALLPPFVRRLSPDHGWEHVFHYDWLREEGQRAPADLPGRRRLSGVLGDLDALLPAPKRKVRRTYEALAKVLGGALAEGEDAALERADERLRAALALVPEHPRSLYEWGIVYLARHRGEDPGGRAARALELAGALDRAPRRASRLVSELVRDAARTGGATLFDADRLFASASPDGLVGYEVMIDECHLAPGAVLLLMRELARELVAAQ